MQTLVRDVLAAWREAERVAARKPRESREYAAATIAGARLRELLTYLTGEQAAAATDPPVMRPEPSAPIPVTSRR